MPLPPWPGRALAGAAAVPVGVLPWAVRALAPAPLDALPADAPGDVPGVWAGRPAAGPLSPAPAPDPPRVGAGAAACAAPDSLAGERAPARGVAEAAGADELLSPPRGAAAGDTGTCPRSAVGAVGAVRGALTLPLAALPTPRAGLAATGPSPAGLSLDGLSLAGLSLAGLSLAGASSRRGRPDTSERSPVTGLLRTGLLAGSLTGLEAPPGRAVAVPGAPPPSRPCGVAGMGVAGMGAVWEPDVPAVRAAAVSPDGAAAGEGTTCPVPGRPALGVPAEAAASDVSLRGVTATGEAASAPGAAPGRAVTGAVIGAACAVPGSRAGVVGTSGALASGALASGALASGVLASGVLACGALAPGTLASGVTEPAGAVAWGWG